MCTAFVAPSIVACCFVFNDAATAVIYTYRHTLSLRDALPIEPRAAREGRKADRAAGHAWVSDVEVSGDHRVGIGGVAVTASSFVTLGSLRLSSRPSDRREREPGSMGGPGACSLSSAPC